MRAGGTVRFAVALLLVLSLWPSGAARADEPYELHYNLRADIPITVVAVAAWLTTQHLQKQLMPDDCRLCTPNGFDRAARNGLVWDNTLPAHRASNWFAMGIAPVGALAGIAGMAALDGKPKNFFIDGLLIVEAVSLSIDLNQLVKFTVGRRRPFVNYQNQDVLKRDPAPADFNASFYSGHTNMAFAIVAATGTVATLRDYRGAPWIWGIGMPVAAATGYFRIAADRHYLTDVLTGALLGSAVGVLVPWLFHGRKRSGNGSLGAANGSLSTGSTPLSLSYSWVH